MRVEIQQPERNPVTEPGSSVKKARIDWESRLSFDETQREFSRGSRFGGRSYALIAWSFMAAVIDTLVVLAMSLLFFVFFAVSSKAQLMIVLQAFELSAGLSGILHFIGGFALGFFLIYLIMMRVFLGFTIGEWACDLRLGSLAQRLNRFYSLKVIARTALLVVTGIVILPFISALTGRDICGGLVGLRLVQVSSK